MQIKIICPKNPKTVIGVEKNGLPVMIVILGSKKHFSFAGRPAILKLMFRWKREGGFYTPEIQYKM